MVNSEDDGGDESDMNVRNFQNSCGDEENAYCLDKRMNNWDIMIIITIITTLSVITRMIRYKVNILYVYPDKIIRSFEALKAIFDWLIEMNATYIVFLDQMLPFVIKLFNGDNG